MKKRNGILFVLIFLTSILYALFLNIQVYHGDSGYYWTVADNMLVNRKFVLLGFPETFRGYFLPLIILIFKTVFNGIWGWRILISIMIAVVFAFALPTIFETDKISSKTFFIGTLVSYIIFLFFWGDFIQYPLSDFPTCFFLLCAVALLRTVYKKEKSMMRIFYGILIGICLYAAYNTRAAFLYAIVLVVCVFLFQNRKEKKLLLYTIPAMLIGVMIIAIPQCIINQNYVDSFSPKVYTEQVCGYVKNLQTQQVYWGMSWDRYETYVGSLEMYPINGVSFLDEAGIEIVKREGIELEEFSIKTIIVLFFKYPLDMIGIYGRHLLSLMTPAYRQCYIYNLFVRKELSFAISFLIWMLCGYFILVKIKSESFDRKTFCWVIPMILPCLLQLLGAPELRFFLMIYIILYFYVCVVIDYKLLWSDFKKNVIPVILCIGFIFIIWVSVFADILASNENKTILINDSNGNYSIENVQGQ